MTYIKVNNTLYPASITGKIVDYEWDNRESKTIFLETTYATVLGLFIDDTPWSIVDEYIDNDNQIIQNEYDNSEFCLVGNITDYRNGTVSIKMGKLTGDEISQIITGGTI